MAFIDEYTTGELVVSEELVRNSTPELLVDKAIPEKDKIVISSDAYAIGKLLETLINTMRR